MTNQEKDLVLSVVKYHMDSELRRKVMTQVPQAYNAWVQREVTAVVRKEDGSKL